MNKVIISIDGASRRNGKPDCLSLGAVFIRMPEFDYYFESEVGSTNQRGELFALIHALHIGLHYVEDNLAEEVFIITDSEYIYNCITKEWYVNWEIKGWVTAAGEPVKNRDLWERAAALLRAYGDNVLAVYHIKGHVFPFGKATARDLINKDSTCEALYNAVRQKFEEVRITKKDNIKAAYELFERNHGFKPPVDIFEEMIVCNMTSDLIAGYHIDRIDSEIARAGLKRS